MPHDTSAHRSPEEQARFTALLADMFEQRIRFNEVLGLRVRSLAAPDVRLRFDMRLVSEDGVLIATGAASYILAGARAGRRKTPILR